MERRCPETRKEFELRRCVLNEEHANPRNDPHGGHLFPAFSKQIEAKLFDKRSDEIRREMKKTKVR